jgi:toxin-antitoxin system PIN domain toxin
VKLLDSNIWLALAFPAHDSHTAAVEWLKTQSRDSRLLFCRSTQQSVLRLLTTAAVHAPLGDQPLTNMEAWSVVEGFLANPRIALAPEPSGLETHWKRFAATSTTSPKLWMDAYLAAFAAAGGYTLVTTDRAFRQFDGIELVLLERG